MIRVSKFSARLVLFATLCIAPLAFAKDKDKHDCEGNDRDKHCQPVPEGGATAMYLLLAGATCVGAIALRSRRQAKNGGVA